MADKYIVQVQPKISTSDGQKMENDLNKRFKRVSDKFGGALKTVGSKLKGVLAGVTAGVVGAIAANPYDEVSKNIDEATGKAGELMDKAIQYNTSAGKMFMAQQLLASKGVKDFDTILDRFAIKLEQARAGEDVTLREFTDETDIIDAFFKAIQSMKGLSGGEQSKMLQEIFGGRQGLQLAPVINEDLKGRSQMLFGEQTSKDFEGLIKGLDDVADWRDITKAWLEQEKLQMNAQRITKETAGIQRGVEFQRAKRQAEQMPMLESFAKTAEATDKMKESLDMLEESVIGTIAPKMEEMAGTNKWIAENMKKHGAWKGLGRSMGLWGMD